MISFVEKTMACVSRFRKLQRGLKGTLEERRPKNAKSSLRHAPSAALLGALL